MAPYLWGRSSSHFRFVYLFFCFSLFIPSLFYGPVRLVHPLGSVSLQERPNSEKNMNFEPIYHFSHLNPNSATDWMAVCLCASCLSSLSSTFLMWLQDWGEEPATAVTSDWGEGESRKGHLLLLLDTLSPLHTHLPATSLWLLNSWQELVSMAMNHQRVDNFLLSLASLIQRPGKCFPFSL